MKLDSISVDRIMLRAIAIAAVLPGHAMLKRLFQIRGFICDVPLLPSQ
jgi:hypothetical protein